MRKHTFLPLLFLIVLLSGCAFLDSPIPSPQPTPTATLPPASANANVIFVHAVEASADEWTFSVTVEHPDTGWEDYADGWDVVLPDGSVVKPNPEAPFTRVLAHPHEEEQPFTRNQGGLLIPPDTEYVTVRAHDLVDGFGGQEVVVQLNQANGFNFRVERASGETLMPPVGLTYQQPDGNHLAAGQIDLLNASPVDIPLSGTPVWVVGVPDETGSPIWVVALEDGTLEGFRVTNEGYQPVGLPVQQLDVGVPPAVTYVDGEIQLLNVLAVNSAEFSHPIPLGSGGIAYINLNGEIVQQEAGSSQRLKTDALPDARLLSDGVGGLLALTTPTDTYQHAVLGDAWEAKSVSLVREGKINLLGVYSDQVIEGIFPIWTDLNADGVREILLTLSNRQGGAQLVVMDESGTILAQGAPIGTGYRWRHQIAAAPVGPEREMEIVDVLTPHIGGVVEFFRLEEGKLVKVAEIGGFTSHVIHTRNLDMAFVGDLDADGRLELLLPRQDLSALGILERTETGVDIVGELPLAGELTSNLAAIPLPDGSMAVGAGMSSGRLRVWLP